MNVEKTRRLIKLISLLQNPSGFNAAEIAKACGVVKRTVFRDLKLLRQAGLDVAYDAAADRHRLADGALLPGLNLSFPEALALLTLGQEAARDDVTPLVGAARTAVNKLAAALPAAIQDELRDAASAVKVVRRPVGKHEGGAVVYDAVVDAIGRRRCLRIHYDSLTEREVICTKLSPYIVMFCRHAWYVVGRSSLHRAARTFHLGRIERFETLTDQYAMPKSFSLDRYLKNAWSMIPESRPDHDVLIRFRRKVARNVADVLWHKTQQCEFRRDGSMLFRARVSGLGEISWWVLGYGDQAEVVEPPELRNLVARHARNMAARYQEGDASAPVGGPHFDRADAPANGKKRRPGVRGQTAKSADRVRRPTRRNDRAPRRSAPVRSYRRLRRAASRAGLENSRPTRTLDSLAALARRRKRPVR